jgi:hypothetical protein
LFVVFEQRRDTPIPASIHQMRLPIGRAETPLNGRRRAARLAPGPSIVHEFALAGAHAIIIG